MCLPKTASLPERLACCFYWAALAEMAMKGRSGMGSACGREETPGRAMVKRGRRGGITKEVGGNAGGQCLFREPSVAGRRELMQQVLLMAEGRLRINH